ncbi:Hypothetical predicted protein [Lecanosticta acicola]|uniref:WIBG Mago-binding domain-containing protein n=1 Tax=Lecanosticta acicola TaxID=111012 RepID=A0AAI8Z3U1_9PEZI|nr:Hypothetical predicted protein [Lecanosticta acicola]
MAPTASPESSTSRSGIRKLSNGESIIPASTRADGSVRKEIRVKPGYKPPEDVEVYKNRTAAAWKNRGKEGVPGAAAAEDDGKLPPHKTATAAAKNAKRREARKKAAAAGTDGNDPVDAAKSNTDATKAVDGAADAKPEEIDSEAEKAKEARKLAKKLRQARELKDKKEKGDNLLPEQFAKVIKIQELMRQLDSLGFDTDGEKKSVAAAKGEETDDKSLTNEEGGTANESAG